MQSYYCETWSVQIPFLGGRQSLPSSALLSGHDTHHNGNPPQGYSQSLTLDYSIHLSGLKTNTWDLSARQSTLIPPTTTKSLITNTRSWTRSAAVLPRLFGLLLTSFKSPVLFQELRHQPSANKEFICIAL